MDREKKLLKNTVVLSVGNICTKLITFFLLPLYTAVLSTEEYGIVDLLNTIVSLLLPILTFHIEQGAFRFLLDERDNNKKISIISSSFFVVLLQLFIYFLVFIFVSRFINNEYKWYLLLNLVLYSFSTLFQQYARGFNNNVLYATSSFISAFSTIICNILFIAKLKYGAHGMLLANAIGQLFCVIYIFIKLKLYKLISAKSVSKTILKKLFKYSLPLIPNSICWWIFNASDRIIVSFFLGMSLTGVLSVSSKFAAFFITFYNVFHLSWIENIAEHFKDKDIEQYFNKMFNVIFQLLSSMVLFIIGIMPICYKIIINTKFFEGYYQVPIIMIATIFNVLISLESAIFVASKNTKPLAIQAIYAAVLNLVINIAFIRVIGLYAASISTLLSYLTLFIIRHIEINKKYFKLSIDKKTILTILIFLIIVIPIYYINNDILNIFSMVFSILFIIIVNKNNTKQIIKLILRKVK